MTPQTKIKAEPESTQFSIGKRLLLLLSPFAAYLWALQPKYQLMFTLILVNVHLNHLHLISFYAGGSQQEIVKKNLNFILNLWRLLPIAISNQIYEGFSKFLHCYKDLGCRSYQCKSSQQIEFSWTQKIAPHFINFVSLSSTIVMNMVVSTAKIIFIHHDKESEKCCQQLKKKRKCKSYFRRLKSLLKWNMIDFYTLFFFFSF